MLIPFKCQALQIFNMSKINIYCYILQKIVHIYILECYNIANLIELSALPHEYRAAERVAQSACFGSI